MIGKFKLAAILAFIACAVSNTAHAHNNIQPALDSDPQCHANYYLIDSPEDFWWENDCDSFDMDDTEKRLKEELI